MMVGRTGACAIPLLWGLLVVGCGARTDAIDDPPEEQTRVEPRPEACNGRDDDLDTDIDEDFRDAIGRYVHDDHCGVCGLACDEVVPNATETRCALAVDDETEGSPRCRALACARGFLLSPTGRCLPWDERMCLPCGDDGDCGDFDEARCARLGDELRCVITCVEGACPDGFTCREDAASGEERCEPPGGSCSCEPGEHFELACGIEVRSPDGTTRLCPGTTRCDDGTLLACSTAPEVCDETDNDCNGRIDDGFLDDRGAYSLDLHHCGACGVDCTTSRLPDIELTCGGDPFAPRCVLDCPDARDGRQPGDRLDANLVIADGCECHFGGDADVPGPLDTSGETLDPNCDGADGIVVESIYVAQDGDDAGPGSPTRPLATLRRAMELALESVMTGAPRTTVFVASGTYTETLELPDGIRVYGGYRRDFLSLDPDGFQVIVRAPADTTAPGGAALVTRAGAGTRTTGAAWMRFHGLDAADAARPAFGAYLEDPGVLLTLDGVVVRAGDGANGTPGTDGVSGTGPTVPATDGEEPRGALEDPTAHVCLPREENRVRGGAGGMSTCGATNANGGAGGTASCGEIGSTQPPGEQGQGGSPGRGGEGGYDAQGPVLMSTGTCDRAVCCGLADFSVPTDYRGPIVGGNGGDGAAGTPGSGCTAPLGTLSGTTWTPAGATSGTDGAAGSGGGGGGAGGTAVIDWYARECEFVDGLGGGGGGGGAGGCGGTAGSAGTSGSPSIAIVLVVRGGASGALPVLRDVIAVGGDGGRGGAGGAGGDGGRGGSGANGGEVPRERRGTPTLAGPYPGARGGNGGTGGPGGGGGGGCGGASLGLWVLTPGGADPGIATLRSGLSNVVLGRGGDGGRGGGGAGAGSAGTNGPVEEVRLDAAM
ncbi:MAG: hypothetical protein IT379_24735 [Deltaproteobacteria bacterium]|nr:hypothetical protein [Deltaproteobacteria bacterium]